MRRWFGRQQALRERLAIAGLAALLGFISVPIAAPAHASGWSSVFFITSTAPVTARRPTNS